MKMLRGAGHQENKRKQAKRAYDDYTRPWSWMRAYSWRPDMTLFSEYNCESQTAAPYELYPSLIPEPQD
jgi:hypothetical protein